MLGYLRIFYGIIQIQVLALEEAKEIKKALFEIFRRLYYKFCSLILLRYNVLKLR